MVHLLIFGCDILICCFRQSDDIMTRNTIKSMVRQGVFSPCKKRVVNFVILVVNGVTILESIHAKDNGYVDILLETFKYPFLSFKGIVSWLIFLTLERLWKQFSSSFVIWWFFINWMHLFFQNALVKLKFLVKHRDHIHIDPWTFLNPHVILGVI